jgi:hypothetical protein
MADAPAWLRESFRDGVDERLAAIRQPVPAYPGADPYCWLAAHDPKRWPCTGQPGKVFERFHFIPRQRVENAVFALLLGAEIEESWNDWNGEEGGAGDYDRPMMPEERDDVILLAAWDPRNAELACEHHHRRFDGHACSPRKPKIIVPRAALPGRVVQFALDYEIEAQLDRFANDP